MAPVPSRRRGILRGMPRVNIAAPEFSYDDTDPDGFHSGMFRPGKSLGARATGATVYDLPPGQAVCPYHYEYGEEEWALVLEGTATLRTPAGTGQFGPMELAFFPTGPEGAHLIRNDSDQPLRVLMFSNIVYPTATAYPDSAKVGVYTGLDGEDVMVERSSNVPYFHGEA
jgi:uncharacterized cupin superfamily protein